MKILITNIYSHKNKGDAAIVYSTIEGLRRLYPNAEIILSSDDLNDVGKYGDFRLIPSFDRLYNINLYRNDLVNNVLCLFNSVRLLVWFNIIRFLFNHGIKKVFAGKTLRNKLVIYKDVDIVYAIGGGYLLTKTKSRKLDKLIGRPYLHLVCLDFFFAKVYNKPVILLHQSIGPFKEVPDMKLVLKYLKGVDLIISREIYTYKLLTENGISNTVLRPDLAFAFKSNGRSYIRKNKSDIIIGLTVRLCLDNVGQSKYENEITKFINRLLDNKSNIWVYFMPQVIYSDRSDNDIIISKRIIEQVDKKSRNRCICIFDDLTPQDLKATIGDCDYFIGTRMHSNIFALTSFVKTIAIAYEYKTTGIMKMLNMERYSTTVESVTDDILFGMLEDLENDNQYVEYLKNKIDELSNQIWNFN